MLRFFSWVVIWLSVAQVSFSQTLQVVQQSHVADSSYYDARKVAPNTYWLAGKKGVLTQTTDCSKFTAVQYPNKGVNILRIAQFDPQHIFLCADSGIIYHYNMKTKEWNVQELPGYKTKVFYNCAVVDENTAYICGGNTAISYAKIALPEGFILKTTDGGKNWNRIYDAPGSMFWDIDYDGKNVVAVKYNVMGSRLLTFDVCNDSLIAKSELYSMLIHENMPGNHILSGGKNFNYKKNGCITTVNSVTNPIFKTIGMIWDVEAVGHKLVASAGQGAVLIFDEMKTNVCEQLNVPTPVNLYQILPLDNNEAFIVGSNKTIVKVKLCADPCDENKTVENSSTH